MKYLVIVSMLLLGGCETFYANSIQSYNDSRNIIRNYIGQNVAARDWVRQQCMVELQMELQSLREEGKHAEARALLMESYPPVVTKELLDDYQDEDSDVKSSINIPHLCSATAD